MKTASRSAATRWPALTVEYTFPIVEKMRGAVFYDVGFVNRGSYDFGASRCRLSGRRASACASICRSARCASTTASRVQSDSSNDSSGKFKFNIGYQF